MSNAYTRNAYRTVVKRYASPSPAASHSSRLRTAGRLPVPPTLLAGCVLTFLTAHALRSYSNRNKSRSSEHPLGDSRVVERMQQLLEAQQYDPEGLRVCREKERQTKEFEEWLQRIDEGFQHLL